MFHKFTTRASESIDENTLKSSIKYKQTEKEVDRYSTQVGGEMLYYTFETNSASFLILEVVYQDVCFVQSSSKLRTAQRRNALNFLLLPTSGY